MATDGMSSTRLLVVGASTALALSLLLSPPVRRPLSRAVRRKKPLEHWIVDLRTASFTRLLAAFGPDGANAPGCEAGVMIASPSRPADHGRDENEDYFYQWTRDGSLCLRVVVEKMIRAEEGQTVELVRGETATSIERRVRDFVTMNARLQQLPNKSGDVSSGGLGEPKFNVDGSAFNASWGRPQNDGPAIRAETLIKYATHLLDRRPSDKSYVFTNLYSTSPEASKLIINLDLDYVCTAWKEPTFDLWEEVEAGGKGVGGHFYDLMVSRRALLSGAQFASRVDDAASAKRYTAAADEISAGLEKFWNPTGELGLEDPAGAKQEGGVFLKPDGEMSASPADLADDLGRVPKELLKQGHILPTLNRNHGQPKPMQVDVCVTLALNHGGDRVTTSESQKGDDGESVWAPWGERALATLDRTVSVFSHVYAINRASPRGPRAAVAIGRYPEDCYDGVGNSVGHPWFLACHGVAESLYLCSDHFSLVDKIAVTAHSAFFFRRFDPALVAGTALRRGDERFEKVVKGLRLWADAFLALGQEYADSDGKMSEQFHRKTGSMRGARELTWSYSSWLSAEEARRGRSIM